jgi:hypothetical protein
MATEVTWYQENRVILARVWEEITIQEVIEVDAEIASHIRHGARTTPLVHVISDISALTKFPIQLVEIRRAITYLREPDLGWTVVVGMSPVMRFLASMVTQIAGVRFRMFPTFEEAIAFLVSRDEGIINTERQHQ